MIEAPHDEDFGPMKHDDRQASEFKSDDLNPAVSGPRDSSLRELKLTRRILEKFGYSDGCEGCLRAQAGLPHRGHSDACRARIYRELGDDEAERPALERALERTAAKVGKRLISGADIPAPSSSEPSSSQHLGVGSGEPWLAPTDEAAKAETLPVPQAPAEAMGGGSTSTLRTASLTTYSLTACRLRMRKTWSP